MTAEPHAVTVRFDADRLVLEPRYDDGGPHYVFPDGHGGDPGAPRAALTLAEAVHARIRPAGTAERILRAWAEGTPRGARWTWRILRPCRRYGCGPGRSSSVTGPCC